MSPDTVSSDIRQRASALVGCDVADLQRVAGRGNSRIYCVTYSDGKKCALKLYPSRLDDLRDRLGVEYRALQFLCSQGETAIPEPVAADHAHGFALYEWIEGDKVKVPDESDVDRAAAFLDRIHGLRKQKAAEQLLVASEACFSGQSITDQIEGRLGKLLTVSSEEPTLARFLQTEFLPLKDEVYARAHQAYSDKGLSFSSDISMSQRTLSPSDFGFHNSLRRPDESLAFIDFEYFGWDDPVKLVSDFLWHPAMHLAMGLKQKFISEVFSIYDGDKYLEFRLKALYPLFGLRWGMILLNEFLPGGWARRAHATGKSHGERDKAKRRQLDKAQHVLSTIREIQGRFIYVT